MRHEPCNADSALPKVFVFGGAYISHANASQSYRNILREAGCLAKDPQEAEVIIWHDEPRPWTPHAFASQPFLRSRYCIGYFVFEAVKAPGSFAAACSSVDEIWTPSAFSARCLYHLHPRITWMPHVIEPSQAVASGVSEELDQFLQLPQDAFVILCNIKGPTDHRKNPRAMEQAFQIVRKELPQARLIIKSPDKDGDRGTCHISRGIHSVTGLFSASGMRALIKRADVVVGPHHAEGWSLVLGDAMASGTLCVASRYSGNLTFMHKSNSFLVPSVESQISFGDTTKLFTAQMRWGHIGVQALAHALIDAFYAIKERKADALIEQAKKDVACYSAEQVGRLMCDRLKAIKQKLDAATTSEPAQNHDSPD